MQQPVRHRPSAVGNEPKRNARRPCMITQRLGAEEGDTPVEQQPAAMQDFDPTYDRCGSFFAIRSHADIHFTVRIGLKAGIFQSGHHRPVIWPTSTTLAVWSGTGLNEAADAAVERSLEVDARAPGGARAGWPE